MIPFNAIRIAIALSSIAMLSACGGGSQPAPVGVTPPPPAAGDIGCTGSCVNAASKLTTADIQNIIGQAVGEASALGQPATIAIVDRVGNVLAVFRMTGARTAVTISSGRSVSGGLEGIAIIPSELAAISKAVTGAYLSSEGNAFSSRTASQIVQEHFNPGELGGPSGPLYGVQFSQLLCSDVILPSAGALSALGATGAVTAGPKAAPLGLSADPGGFPLYKAGTVVGGIGIAADPTYGLDLNITDQDRNVDEMIALAGTFNFGAPLDRRGERITADGKSFRYSDVEYGDLSRTPTATAFASLPGSLIAAPGFAGNTITEGVAFSTAESGIVADQTLFPGQDAFVLVDTAGAPRFAPRDAPPQGVDGLKATEVRIILIEALKIANAARAQIRRPTNSQARVSISVVSKLGDVLGIVRTRDAPIFGTDVAVQKARTAALFSEEPNVGSIFLTGLTQYANAQGAPDGVLRLNFDYITQTDRFLGSPLGKFAYTPRTIGNLARPFFPDGVDGTNNGPLSKPFASYSPFSTGLQYDLLNTQLLTVLRAYLQALPQGSTPTTPQQITNLLNGVVGVRNAGCTINQVARNGIQIFPGGVPIFRGNVMIGAVGVSGDGIDQDDMIAFLGLHNAGLAAANAFGNAPTANRADQLSPGGARLRYVQCPQAPFLNSDQQNVCDGK